MYVELELGMPVGNGVHVLSQSSARLRGHTEVRRSNECDDTDPHIATTQIHTPPSRSLTHTPYPVGARLRVHLLLGPPKLLLEHLRLVLEVCNECVLVDHHVLYDVVRHAAYLCLCERVVFSGSVFSMRERVVFSVQWFSGQCSVFIGSVFRVKETVSVRGLWFVCWRVGV